MSASRNARRTKKALPPRRLRMDRRGRLASAPSFLGKYTGKNVVHGYMRWFGVDLDCALVELQALGVQVDPAWAERARAGKRQWDRLRRERREERQRAIAEAELLLEAWLEEFEEFEEFEDLGVDDRSLDAVLALLVAARGDDGSGRKSGSC